MKIVPRVLLATLMLLAGACGSVVAYSKQLEKPESMEIPTCMNTNARYVFSWAISDDCNDKPRGGSSKGVPVTADNQPHAGWVAIHESGLSKFEQDRRAILAMAGPYKVNFDFLETVGFSPNFTRGRPYQSWGTEYVYVVADTKEFISLQHVMVMYFYNDDGSTSEPMVMKHWRQDWTYQDDELLAFNHDRQWSKQHISSSERQGQWSQAVFQVDDSPRYESIGRWQHNGSFSTWLSAVTRRPLPRREYSVRNDYQVLEGFNRHTITRTGWVQEEENWKLVVDAKGQPNTENPYLSKELGVARYQRIVGLDFSSGDQYMALAGLFWADVRDEWERVIESTEHLNLFATVDGQPLFVPLFSYAQDIMLEGHYDSSKGRAFARQMIRSYIKK